MKNSDGYDTVFQELQFQTQECSYGFKNAAPNQEVISFQSLNS
jgi:hypothetical protein